MPMGLRSGHPRWWTATVLVSSLLSLSCGSRADRDPEAARADIPAGETAPPSADGTAAVVEEVGSEPAASSPVVPDAGRQPTSAPRPSVPAPAPGSAAPESPAVRGSNPTNRTAADSSGRTPSAGLDPGTPTLRNVGRSPVILATVGTISGPAGAALIPTVQGAQVWVKHISAKGGLNGHPVKLIIYDDGGDPARHRAQVQDAVEVRSAIAFLANVEPLTGHSSVEYVTTKRVPVIGLDLTEEWAYSSPMYFPQGSSGAPALYPALPRAFASLVVPQGKKKLGTVICVEATTCDDLQRAWDTGARSAGFDYVYRGRASIAQPDYTAQCLSNRSAGAEVVFLTLIDSAVRNFAQSCARQDYRPILGIPAVSQADGMKDDPHLEGISAASPFFPYFQSGTPATDEYHDAMRRYGQGMSESGPSAAGWAAGRLLERAAANLPEPPTSEAILAGLWTVKDDTLGGLTAPLTFVKDQPAAKRSCWFNMLLRKGAWVSPDGFKLHCL